jgi:hypothetical protein
MGDGDGLESEDRSDDPADDAVPRPDQGSYLYPLGFVACFLGFFIVFLGGLGYVLYKVATVDEKIPSDWYWAVAIGASVLGAPLFLLDEKNPSSVQRVGRFLTQVVGVAAIVAALPAAWLFLTDGLRMLSGVEWIGIVGIALAISFIEKHYRKKKMKRTQP